jgi:hypothetical protein
LIAWVWHRSQLPPPQLLGGVLVGEPAGVVAATLGVGVASSLEPQAYVPSTEVIASAAPIQNLIA